MIIYVPTDWGIRIDEYEVAKETGRFYWGRDLSPYAPSRPQRIARENAFVTKRAALDYLLMRRQGELDDLKRRVQTLRSQIGVIESMLAKEPE